MTFLALMIFWLGIGAAFGAQSAPYQDALQYKVVVVGQSGVGKSSLSIRFTKSIFLDRLETTMGGNLSLITVH